ncbi:MAG: NERD domain-containing protein [Alphaproteobacteria bacterium]
MHKKLWNFTKIITVGIIWLVVFLHIYKFLGEFRWNFNIMNGKHWHKIYLAWQKGWIVNTVEEWAFALFILSALPFFSGGLSIILKKDILQKIINYFFKILKTLFPVHKVPAGFAKYNQRKKEKKISKKAMKDNFVLEKFPVEISSIRKEDKAKKYKTDNIPSGAEAVTKQHHEATHHTHAVSDSKSKSKIDDVLSRLDKHQEKHHQKQVEEEKKAEKEKTKSNKIEKSPPIDKNIIKNFTKKGFKVFENVEIDEEKISFLAIGKHRIILGEVLDQKTDWVADENKLDGMPAMWTSSKGGEKSPVQKIISARRQLKKDLISIVKDENIEAVVCLNKGKVTNLDDVKSKWRRESVTVVNSSKEAKTPFLKNLNDFISENSPAMSNEKIEKIREKLGV